ncbi:MAG: site-specific DNA-methyltransferase [Desulfovibrio sp.]|uniref:site-specific DNA-methyltransferase n=1 Tax=Desulfovibrio sp. TaxID=885 RepID=UPI001A68C034|nr:site-specific DNA-methyltransferase [Desulfovibrio sp.]MBD5418403.1 site-specific DNA-methyltransferase [Desulfovibrio sp.]
MAKQKKSTAIHHVENFTHEEAKRPNIPTSELQSLVPQEQQAPVKVAYQKRNPDLDPQLVWRGKYDGDETLTVKAPPLYIQEKIHPKALVEDLLKLSQSKIDGGLAAEAAQYQLSLFVDFNGIPSDADKTDFYQHEQNWTNRMILGDSLQVMASLAEREGLRGQVQAIYIDPPYGIKFNSNFQWSTASRDGKDGKLENFTREPEQVKAFRDTWADGIHSYLSYLRDRFIVARDLLKESGSIFVQIGDENVHHVRELLDEIFGGGNFVSQITFRTTGGQSSNLLASAFDIILWYAKNKSQIKYNKIYLNKPFGDGGSSQYTLLESKDNSFKVYQMSKEERAGILPIENSAKILAHDTLFSSGASKETIDNKYKFQNCVVSCPPNTHWKTGSDGSGLNRLNKANRLMLVGNTLRYKRYWNDFPVTAIDNSWNDTGRSGFAEKKQYVVETTPNVIARCLLMATDPGDLVLDPTCGSGTTAYVAEQWGRRWITIDTSRVALALARARLMGARYPYYLLADSAEGAAKEEELWGFLASRPYGNNLSFGFVYERVPHITLKSIANNPRIDEIWEKWQKTLEPLRKKLNELRGELWEEWEIPREAGEGWSKEEAATLAAWWKARTARQKEIDEAIAASAEFESLYDKPYEDKKKVRVAGPFTVESISPHRVLGVGPDDELLDPQASAAGDDSRNFADMILDNLKTSGIQQAHKEGKINFTSLAPWPGEMICAEGRFQEGDNEKRAAIFIGPEFGTVARVDLTRAAVEAGEAGFDLLIACGFNFEAQATELSKLGRLPILQARMNADLHMSEALKNTGKGNLFVIFGEPDIEILPETKDGKETDQIMVKINGVDVYYPNSGEIRSDNTGDIACWFVDTDYNGQSFFVRQAYFLGQNDPYKALKTTLKAEIDRDAWESLHSDISRPFPKPKNGHIAVKVINHLGDEVMKVFNCK